MTFQQYEKVISEWVAVKVRPIGVALSTGGKPDDFKTPYFPMLLDGFIGVSDSFEAMKFSLTLLESDFPVSRKVEREKYLEYVIHAFLGDCYVLKELLKTYVTTIQRVYSKKLTNIHVKSILKPVFDSLTNGIEDLMNIRNVHVHQERFKGGGLKDLNVLATLSQHDELLAQRSNEAFQMVLQGWREYMAEVIRIYTGLLDDAFSHIAEIVIENGAVREP
ncbi:hypothetical protein FWP56_22385 [Vibrio vulnificus]|uniref:hypothetical protein n=2 Tax=Vibrio TaxID=662 RepID=UPI001029A829|nr:hypothetical protein [Vibrio vulnificus]EJL6980276.1 hypothetical protein [Vibrio cholerae]EGQ9976242.1 hypothetical protein [Vibrio vulnificus]EIJ0971069.1 hypothetical protein [Vibrio vulnificus]EKJ1030800.1 hypothetical protein [Vibrio cholerae]ELN9189129.1 hypothetical protein [Vibrio cholerae]